jgi:nucleotide-binding universal stress UspA family protein
MNFKRILVGISAIDESKKVANHAIAIAKNCKSELHVITVFDIPDIYNSKLNSDKLNHHQIKERIKEMEHRLLEIKEEAEREGLSVVTELIDENRRPEKSLLTYCNNKNIDLIIVGKGKGIEQNIKEWMLGSTALEIAKHANCSVMLIK